MTNLLIAYPHIPKAGTITTSVAAATGYPAVNLLSGSRANHFQYGTAATDSWVKSQPLVGALASQYLIVARADLLQKQGATGCILERSSDNSTWANQLGYATGFSGATLVGKRSEDFVSTETYQNPAANYSSSSFAYWRLRTLASSALSFTFSKWYCGTWLDLGRDPIAPYETVSEIDSGRGRDPRHVISITWRGITSTKAEEFLAILARSDTEPLFLYTADYHDLLHGLRLLHVRPRNWSRRFTAQGTVEVSVTFEEQI